MLEPECNWIVSLPQLLSVCMQLDHVMGQAFSVSNSLGARKKIKKWIPKPYMTVSQDQAALVGTRLDPWP